MTYISFLRGKHVVWVGGLSDLQTHFLVHIKCVMDSLNSHAPAEGRAGDPSIYGLALYHVAIKAGLHRKAVQVYYIPNLYPVTNVTQNNI